MQAVLSAVSGAGLLDYLPHRVSTARSRMPLHSLQTDLPGITSAGVLDHVSPRISEPRLRTPLHRIPRQGRVLPSTGALDDLSAGIPATLRGCAVRYLSNGSGAVREDRQDIHVRARLHDEANLR